ncbi:hypothetical protein QQF64_010210 [Cirrhinus molitorella]|uniref:Uncharacterized protein n=1 Tax=Cirrhinus molitorella TaxID=172907 RepID=A0ABR3M3C1_9TELE
MIIHSAYNEKHQQSINKQRLQARGQTPPDRNFQRAIYSACSVKSSRTLVQSNDPQTVELRRFSRNAPYIFLSSPLNSSHDFNIPVVERYCEPLWADGFSHPAII